MSFATEAWPFVTPFALFGVLLAALGHPRWSLLAIVLAVAVLLFFRVPRRSPVGGLETILAPANGVVTGIDRLEAPEVGPGEYHRIVTFLSVFNVHVQRAPVAGEVVASRYRPGRKVAAFRADAGEVNESHLTVIERPAGDRIGVRQIAGLLARRIVAYLEPGQVIERQQLMGLIKFGSRVDLYLPAGYRLEVAVGDKLREGLTPVAEAGAER